MSKNDKNIDAYSKALLDKKTEYNEELKKPKEVHQMTEDERRLAEKTMSSALDMLRKERGQKTIAEEERLYEETPKGRTICDRRTEQFLICQS